MNRAVLLTVDALMTALWERSEYSVDDVCGALITGANLMQLAAREIRFQTHRHNVDSDFVPQVEPMLDDVENALRHQEEEPLRWMNSVRPWGELVRLKKSS